MKKINIKRFVIALIIPQVAGFIGSIGTLSKMEPWYSQLVKPGFTPPDWVFGPVWTLLFLCMGVALYMVWQHGRGEHRRLALVLFGAQLSLNVAWSFIFFGAHEVGYAFIEIQALWLAILGATIAFWRVRAAAGILMLIYLAWVSFAVLLNGAIWQLNRV
ncbi:MAG: tryptophan-rich sensory protein [Parcubacteria group bacterium]|nr:tryptophan-rich sensory protein [Parcubacteria group bacterium]MBI2636771.1 tryptophan-rich sensory protein [Parcubacteria group bacterium]